MKRTLILLFALCLLLAACSKPASDTAGEQSDKAQEKNTAQTADAEESFALYPAYFQAPIGQPLLIDADSAPKGEKLVWSSADPSVATVDGEGCVTPVALGETMIICALKSDPAQTSTCGVSVVAEGNIIMWEYPLEQEDKDAMWAYIDENTAAVEPGGEEWPDAWPADIPKLEGSVDNIQGGGVDSPDGLMVTLIVSGADAAKAYADSLEALGFKKDVKSAGDGYYAELTGKGYSITVYYIGGDDKFCSLTVKAGK